jgi:putative ATP-dependent endonuclease of the OLD family
MMARVQTLTVRNYKSIKGTVELRFPEGLPLVLVGPNNSGKSNLAHSLDLVLGESWPSNFDPEEHDFHCRDRNNVPLEIVVALDGVTYMDRYGHIPEKVLLRYPTDDNRPFRMGLDDGSESVYVSNEVRDQCRCILVSADRKLANQLSYSSKYTFLSKLMRQFHKALTADPDRMRQLSDQFEEIKTLFYGVGPFASFVSELQAQVAELSSNLEHALSVDFSAYDPSRPFHAMRVFPHQDGEVRTFEELGTGQEQILALSFAYAYARAFHGQGEGLLLVIEEPEAHLHPLAQRWVGRKIYHLAAEGIQVVVTTHSPAFLDLESLEGIVLARKDSGATTVIQLTKEELAEYCRKTGAAKADADSILPFYAAAATEEILSGLFARKIVLVEGPTEALAIPVYFDRLGMNSTKEGIAFIPVHGVGNLAKWWRFFTAYEIPTYVIFDNDAKDDKDGRRRADVLTALGYPQDKQGAVLQSQEGGVAKRFAVLGINFEEAMRRRFGSAYVELEQEALDVFELSPNQSKPLVARYVARHIELKPESSGVKLFHTLINKIQGPGN